MELKMTAVVWLYNELSKNNISTDSVIERINKESSIWKQAIKMEKQQIIDSYERGWDMGALDIDCNSEKYYSETYKKDNQ